MYPFDPFAELLPSNLRWVAFGWGVAYMLVFFALTEITGNDGLIGVWFATVLPVVNGLTGLHYWLKARATPGASKAWLARLRATAARNPGWSVWHVASFAVVSSFAAGVGFSRTWGLKEVGPLVDVVSYILLGAIVLAVLVGVTAARLRRQA